MLPAVESWQTSCHLGEHNESWMWLTLVYVLDEAFYSAFMPTLGQVICQRSRGLKRRKVLTDTVCYAFLI